MGKPTVRVAVTVIALCMAAWSNTMRPVYAQQPVPNATDTLIVSAADKIDLPYGNAFLSPDGQRIFVAPPKSPGKTPPPDSVCIYAATGDKDFCISFYQWIDPNSVRWSPDGLHVAFNEDLFDQGVDPDIWVIEAATGALTDLTDDLQSSTDSPQSNWDMYPHWSSNSQRLIFIRYVNLSLGVRPTLYTVDLGGGEAQLQTTLNAQGRQTDEIAWSNAGTLVAYNVRQFSSIKAPTPPGLWSSDLNGRKAKRLPTTRQSVKSFIPDDIEFSPDDQNILVFDPRQGDMNANLAIGVNGGVQPVDVDGFAHWAAWEPTGLGLAYLVRDPKNSDRSGLYLVSNIAGKGRQVYVGNMLPPAPSTRRGLTWATNNAILLRDGDAKLNNPKFVLIHLAPKK